MDIRIHVRNTTRHLVGVARRLVREQGRPLAADLDELHAAGRISAAAWHQFREVGTPRDPPVAGSEPHGR